MKATLAVSALALAVSLPLLVLAEGEVSLPSDALLSVERPHGWSGGARYEYGSRSFKHDGTVTDFDMNHMLGQAGYSPFSFLHVYAEAGWNRAERVDRTGQGGFEWAAGATVNLAQQVHSRSPVVGKKQWLALEVDAAYRMAESNFEEDFQWTEITVAPGLRYTINRIGEYLWLPQEPTGVSLLAGVVYSILDGDLGDTSLKGNRDFAFRAGIDLRFASAWVTQLRGIFYSAEDRSLGVGLAYNF